jgi:hypothetical protein
VTVQFDPATTIRFVTFDQLEMLGRFVEACRVKPTTFVGHATTTLVPTSFAVSAGSGCNAILSITYEIPVPFI